MFKVALSGDFLKDDGTFAYPDIDLNLLNHKNIESVSYTHLTLPTKA